MKITKKYLKDVIKEEIDRLVETDRRPYGKEQPGRYGHVKSDNYNDQEFIFINKKGSIQNLVSDLTDMFDANDINAEVMQVTDSEIKIIERDLNPQGLDNVINLFIKQGRMEKTKMY